MYLLFKTIHVACVVVSISLFVVRGIWMIQDTLANKGKWVKVAPHFIDTALLASALALAFTIGQYPFVHHWLTAKVFALLAYIGFGMVAIKYGSTKKIRIIAFVISIICFLYIVSVARTHNVLPWI